MQDSGRSLAYKGGLSNLGRYILICTYIYVYMHICTKGKLSCESINDYLLSIQQTPPLCADLATSKLLIDRRNSWSARWVKRTATGLPRYLLYAAISTPKELMAGYSHKASIGRNRSQVGI